MKKKENTRLAGSTLTALLMLITIASCSKNHQSTDNPEDPAPKIKLTDVNMLVAWQRHLELNLDNDSAYDFSVTSKRVIKNNILYYHLMINSLDSLNAEILIEKIKDATIDDYWAAPLEKGTAINLSTTGGRKWSGLSPTAYLIRYEKHEGHWQYDGPWAGKQNQYAGVRFKIGAKFHYGWLRITHLSGEDNMLIGSIAYNENADQAIAAGQE